MNYKYLAIGFIVAVTVMFAFTWLRNEWSEGRCNSAGGQWERSVQVCRLPPPVNG